VFADKANIRESASINSKIIITLKQGQEVIICEKDHITDTVNGIISFWIPVLYNHHSGYIFKNSLAANSFTHINGNRLLVKNDSIGLAYKIFRGDSMIKAGAYPDKPYDRYSYIYFIHPLFAVKENLYFKLNDSELMYSFDGSDVINAGKCEKENINFIHLSSRKAVPDSLNPIIIGDNVNFRETPDSNAKITGKISKYTFVEVIEKTKQVEKIIDYRSVYWYKIRWKGKIGYISGRFISIPQKHIYDNNDSSTTYLLCNNALFVLNNRKLLTHCMLNYEVYDETLHSFGDLGFGKGYDFVAVEELAYSCGEWGGDSYYVWDGKKIKYFYSSGGIGDGGLSEGNDIIFPSSQSGIPGKLVTYSYSSEMIDIIPVDDCEQNYTDAFDYRSSSILSYNGDSLIEVSSKYLILKHLVKMEFPKFNLVQYEFGDINGDGIEDVVFQVRKEIPSGDPQEEYTYSYKTKIGIAFGKGGEEYKLFEVNEHIVGENDDKRISILLTGSGIVITSFSGFIDDRNDDRLQGFGRKIYSFSYHPADKKIYWESVSTVYVNGLKKSAFKSKKISFKDAWSVSYDNPENYFDE
jgi:uncharacterized protein YgiM (DUF1202 family)